MDHPRPGLRYVDADDLDNSTLDFDGLHVESSNEEALGDVDGFIIDVPSGRPLYVVVNAGGWFTSKFFLLPVGHVGLDAAGNRLVSDLPRERVARFPGFDRDEFRELNEAELALMDERIVSACCPDEKVGDLTGAQRYNRWAHYRSPSWWDSSFYRPDRAETTIRATAAGTVAPTSPPSMPSRDEVRAERDRSREREAVVAKARDASPGDGVRAQPGDVLGLDTGGEQTHIGETAQDEDERRRDAEKDGRNRGR